MSHLYKEIFVKQIYRPYLELPAQPLILDAGAHLGLASIYYLHKYPHAKLVSVEANPVTFRLLKKNIKPWASRINIINKALSSKAGRVPFFVSEDNPVNVNAGLKNRLDLSVPVLKTTVECLDAQGLYEYGRFDFAKIDIEGAEYDVLNTEFFRPEYVAELVVEFHDITENSKTFDDLIHMLTSIRGYVLYDIDMNLIPLHSFSVEFNSTLLRFIATTHKAK